MIKLIKPTFKYKKSFIAGRKEFQSEEKTPYENIVRLQKDFGGFLTQMRDREQGKNLPKGRVPSTAYWLTDGKNFIGETSVRHYLTAQTKKEGGHIGYSIRPSKRNMGYGTHILKLALQKAKKLSIKKVLVTCNNNNVGSRKIIEFNGGVLQDTIKHNGKKVRRYWIKIK